jgi:hypothetical protein
LLGQDVAGREDVVNPWLTTIGSCPDVRHRGSNGWMKGESDGEIACVSHAIVVNPSRLGGAGAARALRGAADFVAFGRTSQEKAAHGHVAYAVRQRRPKQHPLSRKCVVR